MTNEMEKKVEALLQNEDEINTIFVGEPDQILANFAARGIEMSKEELGELSAGLVAGMGLPEDGELSENDLENVAGGGIGTAIVCGAVILTGVRFFQGFNDAGAGKANNSKCPVYNLGYKAGKAIMRPYD